MEAWSRCKPLLRIFISITWGKAGDSWLSITGALFATGAGGWLRVEETKLNKRLSRLTALYIEWVWCHTERAGSSGETPMQDAKGSTNPPFGDYAHRILDSNRVASDYLFAALEETSNCGVKSSDGVLYRDVLQLLRYNPGLINHWRDKNPTMHRAFRECCQHVARGVLYIFRRTKPDRDELCRRLGLSPEDPEALVVRRHPLDEEESRGRTRTGQKIDTMHTRRLMVEQLEQLEASTDYRGIAAMEVLSERKAKEGKDWSVAKIRKARTEVNRERASEAGEVA
jgi:hypothetical protein